MNKAQNILIATSPNRVKLTGFDRMFCGSIAAMIAQTLISPLDVIKVNLQVSKTKGLIGIIEEIYNKNGILAFWSGNSIRLINSMPQNSIKFAILGELRTRFNQGQPLNNFQRLLYGGIAGVISQTIVFPIDLVHTRMALNPNRYSGLFNAFATIAREEGILSLWSGVTPTILGAIPYESCQYFGYDGLCDLYRNKISKDGSLSPSVCSVLAGISGIFSQAVVYPFDIVRRRMMASKGELTMSECFKDIYVNEGILGFFKGIQINMIKIYPGMAIKYAAYEELKRVILNIKRKHSSAPIRDFSSYDFY